jgi:hypothetical protein
MFRLGVLKEVDLKDSMIFWRKGVQVVAPGHKRYELDERFYKASLAEICGDAYMANKSGIIVKAESARIRTRCCAAAADVFVNKNLKQMALYNGARKDQKLPEELRGLKVPVVSPPDDFNPEQEICDGLMEMSMAIVKYPDGTFELREVPMLTGRGADLYAEYIHIFITQGQKAAKRHVAKSVSFRPQEAISEYEEEEFDEMEIEYV